MDYIEVQIGVSPFSEQDAEIISALLAEIGFDSFTQTDNTLNAYIPSKDYNEAELKQVINHLPFASGIKYEVTEIPDQNWNVEWEKNFSPIAVGNYCYVRAPFHESQEGYKFELVIEPKMAFGTGHHETTWLMLSTLFTIDVADKLVLDMGCGTGILAIAAEKLGAKKVLAIDNDHWAYENTLENVTTNGCSRIEALLGDASALGKENYDIILANINLNILVADMSAYIKSLSPNGLLIMSGILDTDLENLKEVALKHGLKINNHSTRNKWALLVTQYSKKP